MVEAIKEVTVELRPHIGQKKTEFGVVNVEHDQFMVFVSTDQQPKPRQVGYIGKKPGSPFNGIYEFRKLPEELKTAIVSAIEAKRGEKIAMHQPAEIPPDMLSEPSPDPEDEELGEE